MRPTHEETLRAIARVLSEVVLPGTTDEYVATQIRHMLVALDDVARGIQDEFCWLLEGSRHVTEILQDAVAAIADTPPPAIRQLKDDMTNAVSAARISDDEHANPIEMRATYEVLRTTLSSLILMLGRHGELFADSQSLRRRIHAYLRASVARSS